MADEHDVPLKSYKPLYAPDLMKGKVAFVSGGGSGICFRITEFLMRHGCNCAIASRNKARVEEAADRLMAATGATCLPLVMDVRKVDQINAAVAATIEKLGRLDVVVNGAAGNFLCAASALSERAIQTVFAIDALGTFFLSQAAYKQWFEGHGGGVIINITATLAYRGDPMQVHAGAAKAAIDAMTRHMAREWGPSGVRVNSLAPGPIDDTEGMRRLGGFMPEEVIAKYKARIPAQRLGTREDIGNAVLYLASDAGSYVTGTILVVDGGTWFADASLDSPGISMLKAAQKDANAFMGTSLTSMKETVETDGDLGGFTTDLTVDERKQLVCNVHAWLAARACLWTTATCTSPRPGSWTLRTEACGRQCASGSAAPADEFLYSAAEDCGMATELRCDNQ